MSSKSRSVKPVNISKLTPFQIKILNDNTEDVILNPGELKRSIKEKKELSKLIPSIKNGRTSKNFGLSKEEEYLLKTTKTKEEKARELDEKMEKDAATIIDENAKIERKSINQKRKKDLEEFLESLKSKKGGRRRTKKNRRSRKNKK